MASVPVFVNIVWDPTVGYNTHTWWDPVQTAAPPPGVPKPNSFNPAIEMIATPMWTAGYFLGLNKFSTKVFHLGMPICVDDHDQGILIPDITIPPPNIYYAIMWPFSGRQMTFKASTVQMEGKPTSCSQLGPVPLAMLTCGDPLTLPLSFPIVNWTHSLTVGLTPGDFLAGVINIGITVAIDALFEWGGKLLPGRAAREAAEAATERAAREAAMRRSYWNNLGRKLGMELLGKLGLTPKALAKRTVSGLAGFTNNVAQGNANPSFKVGVGGGPVPTVGVQSGGEANDPNRFATTNVGGVPVSGTTGNTPTNDPLHII